MLYGYGTICPGFKGGFVRLFKNRKDAETQGNFPFVFANSWIINIQVKAATVAALCIGRNCKFQLYDSCLPCFYFFRRFHSYRFVSEGL